MALILLIFSCNILIILISLPKEGGQMVSVVQKTELRGMRSLAEAVILQSMSDLSDKNHCQDCRRFFRGEGFTLWAQIAELGPLDQLRVLQMIQKQIQSHN
jgi:hypothetical protein